MKNLLSDRKQSAAEMLTNEPTGEGNSSKAGLQEKLTRATFIVNEEKLRTLKDIAYTERKTLKEVVDEMLSEYIGKYEPDAIVHDPKNK